MSLKSTKSRDSFTVAQSGLNSLCLSEEDLEGNSLLQLIYFDSCQSLGYIPCFQFSVVDIAVSFSKLCVRYLKRMLCLEAGKQDRKPFAKLQLFTSEGLIFLQEYPQTVWLINFFFSQSSSFYLSEQCQILPHLS